MSDDDSAGCRAALDDCCRRLRQRMNQVLPDPRFHPAGPVFIGGFGIEPEIRPDAIVNHARELGVADLGHLVFGQRAGVYPCESKHTVTVLVLEHEVAMALADRSTCPQGDGEAGDGGERSAAATRAAHAGSSGAGV